MVNDPRSIDIVNIMANLSTVRNRMGLWLDTDLVRSSLGENGPALVSNIVDVFDDLHTKVTEVLAMINATVTKDGVKYPDITVHLVGEDGNAFAIMGKVVQALKRAHVPQTEIDKFFNEATADGYDELLQTVMRWVVVD